MAFWTSGALLLASVILFSLLQQRITDKDVSECFKELSDEKVYGPYKRNPTRLSTLDHTMKINFGKETVNCGGYIKWTSTFSKPNITFLEKTVKEWLLFDKYNNFYKFFTVLFWDAGTIAFPYPIALYIVCNIPLDVFITGFYGQEGVGDVVRDYLFPLPLLGHRLIIQVHKQWAKIDNPKTSTYIFPFNETQFEYETDDKNYTLDFPISAKYFRLKPKGLDQAYRSLEDAAVKCIESLKEKIKDLNKAVDGIDCLNTLNSSITDLANPKSVTAPDVLG